MFLAVGGDSDAAENIYAQHWEPFESELGLEHRDKYFFPYALIRNSSSTKASAYRRLKDHWESDAVTGGARGEVAAKAIVSDLREYLPAFHAVVGDRTPTRYLRRGVPRKIDCLASNRVAQPTYPYFMELINSYLLGETSDEQLAWISYQYSRFVYRAAHSSWPKYNWYTYRVQGFVA